MANNKRTDFLSKRLAYISGLKQATEQQKMFADLAAKFLNDEQMTTAELRAFKTLEAAELADEKAAATKRAARKLISEKTEAERKQRTHNMINAAGLMGLAGLLDKKTGKPLASNEEMLGALLELANRHPTDLERENWKRAGAELLNAAKQTQRKA